MRANKGKPKRAKRKPGEKKRVIRKLKPLSPFSEPRVPEGYTRLAEFVMSCEGEISVAEAIREFQANWCGHPRSAQYLLTTRRGVTDDATYSITCGECGRQKSYKGSPPGGLTQ